MSTPNSALSFLNSDCYQIYNRDVAKMLKCVNAAIMLSELINRFEYHSKRKEIVSHPAYGEMLFYYTAEKGEERTCLSRKCQDRAIQILVAWGFIKKFTFGSPPQRYFQIQEDKILEAFGFKKINTDLSQTDKSNGHTDLREILPFGTNRICPNGQIDLYTKEPQQENVCMSGDAGPEKSGVVEKCEITHPNGKKTSISFNQVIEQSILQGIGANWLMGEMEEAFAVMKNYKGQISDWFKFITGTVEKIRLKKQNESYNHKKEKPCQNKKPQEKNTFETSKQKYSEHVTAIPALVDLAHRLKCRDK